MKPVREHATNNAQTYFVTSDTWERRALFNVESWARLFFKTLLSHRGDAYFLHEFVLMPDHFHLLMTPETALEKAVQLIKGGFSFRAKKELGSNMEVWQRGFSDHRIRDFEDYDKHRHYIHLNPVKKHLSASPAEYRYSSAYPGWKLDPIPQGLKPGNFNGIVGGTTEVVPFQSKGQYELKPADFSAADICGEPIKAKTNTHALLMNVVDREDYDAGVAALKEAEGQPTFSLEEVVRSIGLENEMFRQSPKVARDPRQQQKI